MGMDVDRVMVTRATGRPHQPAATSGDSRGGALLLLPPPTWGQVGPLPPDIGQGSEAPAAAPGWCDDMDAG